ncbi:unnamed protein product, partial [Thelazia callipaeda]|uniref:Double-strand-break repair protein rad21 homolog n=1 Tax=Thelazia callipaeda TaxID=103827 RepID=A0A0N5D4N7_THECL
MEDELEGVDLYDLNILDDNKPFDGSEDEYFSSGEPGPSGLQRAKNFSPIAPPEEVIQELDMSHLGIDILNDNEEFEASEKYFDGALEGEVIGELDISHLELDTSGNTEAFEGYEAAYFDSNKPGPSGLQRTKSMPATDHNSLDEILAEIEETSVVQGENSNNLDTEEDLPTLEQVNSLLAINEAFKETLENLVRRKMLRVKLRQSDEPTSRGKIKKVPISRFIYPYFRDSHNM